MARFRETFTAVMAGKMGAIEPQTRQRASLDLPGATLQRASFVDAGAANLMALHAC